jgi:predicted lipid-binding transport protein (Tim44 family)
MSMVKHNGNGQAKAVHVTLHGRDAATEPARADHSAERGATAMVDPAFAGEPQRPDEQLLLAYRQGDRASFAQLVSRYQRELFHFLVRFLGDRAAAEDVFQETFLQVHQSAEQFDT